MPIQPGYGNPYGDEDINPLTGEKYPHLEEAPDTDEKEGDGAKEVVNGVGEGHNG